MCCILGLIVVLISIFGVQAVAQNENQQPAEQAQGADDLRSKVQNPVSSMYSLPLKLTADFGAPDGNAYFFNDKKTKD